MTYRHSTLKSKSNKTKKHRNKLLRTTSLFLILFMVFGLVYNFNLNTYAAAELDEIPEFGGVIPCNIYHQYKDHFCYTIDELKDKVKDSILDVKVGSKSFRDLLKGKIVGSPSDSDIKNKLTITFNFNESALNEKYKEYCYGPGRHPGMEEFNAHIKVEGITFDSGKPNEKDIKFKLFFYRPAYAQGTNQNNSNNNSAKFVYLDPNDNVHASDLDTAASDFSNQNNSFIEKNNIKRDATNNNDNTGKGLIISKDESLNGATYTWSALIEKEDFVSAIGKVPEHIIVLGDKNTRNPLPIKEENAITIPLRDLKDGEVYKNLYGTNNRNFPRSYKELLSPNGIHLKYEKGDTDGKNNKIKIWGTFAEKPGNKQEWGVRRFISIMTEDTKGGKNIPNADNYTYTQSHSNVFWIRKIVPKDLTLIRNLDDKDALFNKDDLNDKLIDYPKSSGLRYGQDYYVDRFDGNKTAGSVGKDVIKAILNRAIFPDYNHKPDNNTKTPGIYGINSISFKTDDGIQDGGEAIPGKDKPITNKVIGRTMQVIPDGDSSSKVTLVYYKTKITTTVVDNPKDIGDSYVKTIVKKISKINGYDYDDSKLKKTSDGGFEFISNKEGHKGKIVVDKKGNITLHVMDNTGKILKTEKYPAPIFSPKYEHLDGKKGDGTNPGETVNIPLIELDNKNKPIDITIDTNNNVKFKQYKDEGKKTEETNNISTTKISVDNNGKLKVEIGKDNPGGYIVGTIPVKYKDEEGKDKTYDVPFKVFVTPNPLAHFDDKVPKTLKGENDTEVDTNIKIVKKGNTSPKVKVYDKDGKDVTDKALTKDDIDKNNKTNGKEWKDNDPVKLKTKGIEGPLKVVIEDNVGGRTYTGGNNPTRIVNLIPELVVNNESPNKIHSIDKEKEGQDTGYKVKNKTSETVVTITDKDGNKVDVDLEEFKKTGKIIVTTKKTPDGRYIEGPLTIKVEDKVNKVLGGKDNPNNETESKTFTIPLKPYLDGDDKPIVLLPKTDEEKKNNPNGKEQNTGIFIKNKTNKTKLKVYPKGSSTPLSDDKVKINPDGEIIVNPGNDLTISNGELKVIVTDEDTLGKDKTGKPIELTKTILVVKDEDEADKLPNPNKPDDNQGSGGHHHYGGGGGYYIPPYLDGNQIPVKNDGFTQDTGIKVINKKSYTTLTITDYNGKSVEYIIEHDGTIKVKPTPDMVGPLKIELIDPIDSTKKYIKMVDILGNNMVANSDGSNNIANTSNANHRLNRYRKRLPKTNDPTNITIYLSLLMISLLGLTLILKKSKKDK